MPPFKNREGERRGRLTLTSRVDATTWWARCDCGERIKVRTVSQTKSCGCLSKEWAASGNARRTHGLRKTPEYRAWAEIKQLCMNPNNPRYSSVGGAGIKMDPEWIDSFTTFINDVGPRPGPEFKLGRVDRSAHYVATNMTWVPRKKST